jgi:hypothetical protein
MNIFHALFASIMSLWVSFTGGHVVPVVQPPIVKNEMRLVASTTAIVLASTTIEQDTGTTTASSTIIANESVTIPSTMEIINGISVPPEPDQNLNNSTLAGIDMNKNGVRDDIERKIAKMVKSSIEFSSTMKYLKEYQRQITEPTPKDRDAALVITGSYMCASEKIPKNIRNLDLFSLFENTPARKKAMRDYNDILVAFTPMDFPPCIKD